MNRLECRDEGNGGVWSRSKQLDRAVQFVAAGVFWVAGRFDFRLQGLLLRVNCCCSFQN